MSAVLPRQARVRVLVTGVGGAPGFDLARRLMALGCEVIGADAHPRAAGLLIPGLTPRLLAPAGDPDYGARLVEVCQELRPDALMPTVEQELAPVTAVGGTLAGLGVRTWLPPLDAVTACADKAVFHAVLREHGIPMPRTVLPHRIEDLPEGSQLVVKPRFGQGAKNVHVCSTRRQAAVLCELVADPIVQEKIAGAEFTADCLVDRSGHASVILRHRLVVRNGLAVVAATFHDSEVAERVRQTLAAVGAVGLCCTQGFIRDGARDRVVITEMNARIAGAFPITEAAGADLVAQALNGLLGRPVDHDRLAYRAGVVLTKYVETLAVQTCPHATTAVPASHARQHSEGHDR